MRGRCRRAHRARAATCPAAAQDTRCGRRHPRFAHASSIRTRKSGRRRGAKGGRRSRPISRVLSWAVIPLGAASPQRSSNLPGSNAGRAKGSLFGLAPGGVCRTGLLPDSRCALTAPFHPCRPSGEDVGGIFLLHFPSACAAQALPGTLPCGARTFLGIPEGMTRLPGRLRQGAFYRIPCPRMIKCEDASAAMHARATAPTATTTTTTRSALRRPLAAAMKVPRPASSSSLDCWNQGRFGGAALGNQVPYNALRGAPVSSAASLAAVDGGR